MTTNNKVLLSYDRGLEQDIATLELQSRELDAYLKGPKEVKVKAAPKYVTGVTKSQGDEEYKQNLKAFGSKQLARSFGMNMGMLAVQQDVLNSLEGHFGSGGETREFVDLATQVICHLLIQCATYATDSGDLRNGLVSIRDLAVSEVESSSSISAMLKSLDEIDADQYPEVSNLISGNVYRFLRPLNLVHIERVDAQYSPRVRARNTMLSYIDNEQARLAVIRYLTKHELPDDVLAPSAMDGSNADTAFKKYPGKDVAATFEFYKKAVKENLDISLGIQVGDVKAALDAAIYSLQEAANKGLKTAQGQDFGPSAVARLRKGFDKAISDLKKINPSSDLADEHVAYVTADLADLLGAYSWDSSGNASLKNNKLKNAGLDSGTYAERVKEILTIRGDRNAATTSISQADIEYLDARDAICPIDVEKEASRAAIGTVQASPRYYPIVDALSVVFYQLYNAHSSLMPIGRVEAALRPSEQGVGTLQVTQAFADLIGTSLTTVRNYTWGNKPSSGIDENLLEACLKETYDLLLGATTPKVKSAEADCTFLSVEGNNYSSSWGISKSTLNDIAAGVSPTYTSAGIEDAILNLITREGRDVDARDRRITRAYALSCAQVISDTILSIRAQATNTNVPIQVRRNPAMSAVQMGLTGAGSLVGAHAVSAIANRFVEPASSSVTSHALNYGPSLALATYGAVKASKGEKDLGYSLLGGAIAHIGLRYAFSNLPALRFSENPFLKALQAPTNGLAHLVGDESMAASALTPASIKDKEDVGAYVLRLVNANDCESLCYIAVQLYKSGLYVDGDGGYVAQLQQEGVDGLLLKVRDPQADLDAKKVCKLACDLTRLKCVMIAHGLNAMMQARTPANSLGFNAKYSIDGKAVNFKEASESNVCKEALAKCKQTMSKILNVNVDTLSGFILEPGYNMNVYSGEDQVSYLQPAPHVTAQSGVSQLDHAISRARRLGPQELLQEGIEDLVDVSIIRATSKTARMIEHSGKGTSLGMSRMSPSHELVALEVEGANGLWPVAPERQQSVPQGALNYSKIGHASDVTVSSEGLFNRGIFTPRYGR